MVCADNSLPLLTRRVGGFALALLLAGVICEVRAQAPVPVDRSRASTAIVVMLAADEAEALRLRTPSDKTAPAFLRSHGLLQIEPGLPDRSRRTGGGAAALFVRLGLDRVFRAAIEEGQDPAAVCRQLETDPRVVYAHPDYLGEGGGGTELPAAEDTNFAAQWHLSNTGQTGGSADADMDVVEAWRTTVGRPETLIAVLDTGIDGDHREFRGRVARGGFDFVNQDDDPEADHHHGSRVSGVIGANTNNRFGVAGVHWDASILPVKILDEGNGGTTLDLAAGLIHAADSGADIANLSLVRYPDTSTLRLAVQYAHAAGVIQIGCNGNDGSDSLNYPASYPEVLATGWTDHTDTRFSNSNFTPTLDVVAPGRTIRTVVHGSPYDGTSLFSGCSAATPSAAGVAALLRALDPTLTHEQVAAILRATADDQIGDPAEDVEGRDDYHGWGRINAQHAVAALGLVSSRRIHVHDISLHRVSGTRLDVAVIVLDDLRGVEAEVEVQGTLTPPGGDSVSLSGTTGANGVATLPYTPPEPLPPGPYTFVVDSLTLAEHAYDTQANAVTTKTHDPALDGVHVSAMWAEDSLDTLTVDVQVVDDDGLPEDQVAVSGRLIPPVGLHVEVQQLTRGAKGAIARFVFSPPVPPGNDTFDPGNYRFEVTALEKPGFVHETDRDAGLGRIMHIIVDGAADPDGDGIPNDADTCRHVADAGQSDGDEDGIGDACDTCPELFDPAQRDTDGDGTGNRCDCAPWDASATTPPAVLTVRVEPDRLSWKGVAGADRYDVTRGTLEDLGGDELGGCIGNDIAVDFALDFDGTAEDYGFGLDLDDTPASGQGFIYLVRADDEVCGPGPLGAGHDGAPRINNDLFACD